jgi:chromosome segregation ATPase
MDNNIVALVTVSLSSAVALIGGFLSYRSGRKTKEDIAKTMSESAKDVTDSAMKVVDGLETRVQAMELRLNTREKQIAELRQSSQEKDVRLVRLQASLEEKDRQISNLSARVEELERQRNVGVTAAFALSEQLQALGQEPIFDVGVLSRY